MLSAGVGRAETSCPDNLSDDAAFEEAGRRFALGETRYGEGELAGAVSAFQCSYHLAPHAATLANVAHILEELGRAQEALTAYRALVENHPGSDHQADAEQAISRLEPPEDPAPPEQPPTEEPPDQESNPSGTSLPGAEPPSRLTLRMSGPRIGAWTTFGLSLASVAVGIVMIAVAHTENELYTSRRDDGATWEELRDDRKQGVAHEAMAWAFFGGSAAAAVASVVLFLAFDGQVAEPRSGRASDFALGCGPQGCSAAWRF